MNICIPMAGRGQRFVDAGYDTPKPLLQAHGKTLLEWSVDSLPLELATTLTFVGLREHNEGGWLEGFIRERYASYGPQCVWLEAVTRGQSETVSLGRPNFDPNQPLLIYNIDTVFVSKKLAGLLSAGGYAGVLGSFASQEPRFSYARTNGEGRVVEVREKEVISPYALTGLYHFASCAEFLALAREAIEADRREKGEFYVAPLYNRLIEEGKPLALDVADRAWIVGTPEEYTAFCAGACPVAIS